MYEHMWLTHDSPVPAASHFTVYNVFPLHALSLNSKLLQEVVRAPFDPGEWTWGRGGWA